MAVRGNAGFRYTPPGASTVTVELAVPLQDVSAQLNVVAYAWDSEDMTVRETVTTSADISEITATLLMHPSAAELLVMLGWMIRGVVASYYPDLGDAESFPSILADPRRTRADLTRETRRAYGQWNHTLSLRHATGGSYAGLLQRRT